MKKLAYNIQEAISLRGKTFYETGYTNGHPEDKINTIDFRTSLNIARDENQWGNIPSHIIILGDVVGYDQNKLKATVNKAEWRRCSGLYRKYMRQCCD